MQDADRCRLEELAERIRVIQDAHGGDGVARGGRVATGWPDVDAVLDGGLTTGAVHEWLGQDDGAAGGSRGPGQWQPALAVLVHLARRAMVAAGVRGGPGWAVWIGRQCWPYAHGLAGGEVPLMERSLWVDPPDAAGRLWAIDLAARCGGVHVVVADGSGL
ncbi:MAG: hypothetical protein WD118_00490, partial [Phycisphaeraceae bacterium]